MTERLPAHPPSDAKCVSGASALASVKCSLARRQVSRQSMSASSRIGARIRAGRCFSRSRGRSTYRRACKTSGSSSRATPLTVPTAASRLRRFFCRGVRAAGKSGRSPARSLHASPRAAANEHRERVLGSDEPSLDRGQLGRRRAGGHHAHSARASSSRSGACRSPQRVRPFVSGGRGALGRTRCRCAAPAPPRISSAFW